MKIDPNSNEGKRIKERMEALLQAMDKSAPEGSVREVALLKDPHGEVIVQVTSWKKAAGSPPGRD